MGLVMSRPGLHSDWGERLRRAAVVKAWREEYGDWCPGYLVAAHYHPDLTADHLVPVGMGGEEAGTLSVLCRACNARKRDGRRTRSSVVRSRSW
jgi:5-methylcytosine-specific restriction protein A